MQNENREVVKQDAARHASSDAPALAPAVDIWETEAGIDLTADLPGVSREALEIKVDGETLTIAGTVSLGEPEQMESLHVEVREPLFRRSFTLSRELDSSAIQASLKDGVLRMHIPRQEEAKPRKI
nr:Hsp20/alpha crystallin family protein [Pseudomonas sp.]